MGVFEFFKLQKEGIFIGAFVGAGLWLFFKSDPSMASLESLAATTPAFIDTLLGSVLKSETLASTKVFLSFVGVGAFVGMLADAIIDPRH